MAFIIPRMRLLVSITGRHARLLHSGVLLIAFRVACAEETKTSAGDKDERRSPAADAGLVLAGTFFLLVCYLIWKRTSQRLLHRKAFTSSAQGIGQNLDRRVAKGVALPENTVDPSSKEQNYDPFTEAPMTLLDPFSITILPFNKNECKDPCPIVDIGYDEVVIPIQTVDAPAVTDAIADLAVWIIDSESNTPPADVLVINSSSKTQDAESSAGEVPWACLSSEITTSSSKARQVEAYGLSGAWPAAREHAYLISLDRPISSHGLPSAESPLDVQPPPKAKSKKAGKTRSPKSPLQPGSEAPEADWAVASSAQVKAGKIKAPKSPLQPAVPGHEADWAAASSAQVKAGKVKAPKSPQQTAVPGPEADWAVASSAQVKAGKIKSPKSPLQSVAEGPEADWAVASTVPVVDNQLAVPRKGPSPRKVSAPTSSSVPPGAIVKVGAVVAVKEGVERPMCIHKLRGTCSLCAQQTAFTATSHAEVPKKVIPRKHGRVINGNEVEAPAKRLASASSGTMVSPTSPKNMRR